MTQTDTNKESRTANRRFAQWRMTWLMNILPRINFYGVLKVLCSEICHCAKRQNVTSNPKRTEYNKKNNNIWQNF